jgi:hypothetical protein
MSTDWGAVSSWVATGISVTVFGAGTVRAMWNRPQVDWALTGEMRWPGQMTDTRLTGKGTVSNFGDGDAHRVTLHVRRGSYDPDVLCTSPLLKPGDALEFELSVDADSYDATTVWVTWTSPPIRRRREKTSSKMLVHDHMNQTDTMRQRRVNRKAVIAFVERDLEQGPTAAN